MKDAKRTRNRRSLVFVNNRSDAQGVAKRKSKRTSASSDIEMSTRKQEPESESGWGNLFGLMSSGNDESEQLRSGPDSSAKAANISRVNAPKRRSAIEKGELMLLNSANQARKGSAIPSEQVEAFVYDAKRDMAKALKVVNIDGGASMYRIATKKVEDLCLINIRHISSEAAPSIFAQLHSTIVMHGSLALKMPVDDVSTKWQDRIGYCVGNKVFTAQELQSISSGAATLMQCGVFQSDLGDVQGNSHPI
jgi:hypothetical protein